MARNNDEIARMLPKLPGSDNYAIWAADLRVICEEEEIWEYVTGKITLPSMIPKTPEREATSAAPVIWWHATRRCSRA